MTAPAALACSAGQAFDITGASTTQQCLDGTLSGTVEAAGTLTNTTASPVLVLQSSGAGPTLANAGTIQVSGNQPAIKADTAGLGDFSFTLNNGGLLKTTGNQAALKIVSDIGGGTVMLNNSGTGRITTTSAASALNLGDNPSGTIALRNLAGGTIEAQAGIGILAGSGTIGITNAGLITGASGGAGISVSSGSLTLTNQAGGSITSTGGDGVNASTGAAIGNAGTIAGAKAGNNGITYTDGLAGGSIVNGGTANAAATISGPASGISGGAAPAPVAIDNYGRITGGTGSAIAFATAATSTMTITNEAGGVIKSTGTGAVQDSAIHVAGRASIINGGTIQTTGTLGAGNSAANLAAMRIGGGTITNQAGALIGSANQGGIVVDNSSGGNAPGAVTISNYGTISARLGGSAPAIGVTSTLANTLNNYGTINGDVTLGGTGNTINLYTGSLINGGRITGGGSADTVNLIASGGAANSAQLVGVSGVGAISVQGGNWSTPSNAQQIVGSATITAGATLTVGGDLATTNGTTNSGVLNIGPAIGQINGAISNAAGGRMTFGGSQAQVDDVTNAGALTIATSDKTLFYGGLKNSGTVSVTAGTVYFLAGVSVAASGVITGVTGGVFVVSGDFLNHSTQATAWDTAQVGFEFQQQSGLQVVNGHTLAVAGVDVGADAAGYDDNFAMGSMTLDPAQSLWLTSGRDDAALGALYVGALAGLVIDGSYGAGGVSGMVTNITGNGIDVYYDPSQNVALHDRTYALQGGGDLIPIQADAQLPEPPSPTLLILPLIGLALMRRERRAVG